MLKEPPVDHELNEHPADKLFFIVTIVLASLSMVIFIGGSFVKAIRMSEQPPAVEQTIAPAGDNQKLAPEKN
nr:hypothetical protein [Acetobacter conturbans]